jgi:hypothetical protein
MSFPVCNEQYSVTFVPLYYPSDNDSPICLKELSSSGANSVSARPTSMVHEAVKNAFSGFYEYSKAFVLGTITRFQKLRWLGKLVIIVVLLFYIALVTVFLVIGPGTVFQVHTVLINDLSSMLRIPSISSISLKS